MSDSYGGWETKTRHIASLCAVRPTIGQSIKRWPRSVYWEGEKA